MSLSSITHECDNATTPYYPIAVLLSAKWSLTGGYKKKTKENFKLLVLKVVAVAYERWSHTRSSKYSDLTWKMLVF